jgi:hypothetical protein
MRFAITIASLIVSSSVVACSHRTVVTGSDAAPLLSDGSGSKEVTDESGW